MADISTFVFCCVGRGHLVPSIRVLSSNQEIQTYAIALINALFLKAPEDKRQDKHLNPLDLPVTVSSTTVWKGPWLSSRPPPRPRSENESDLSHEDVSGQVGPVTGRYYGHQTLGSTTSTRRVTENGS
ncbi:Hypothetical predicted protein [Marmota monax]|uniref:ELMO armadillo-like helical domain-containing protein n=1 Tax=Marmota monax TaxID=9995 RepID=A0A5E4B9Y4_MARMO|nr:Hypothetical predicted protein [Marmota monax]